MKFDEVAALTIHDVKNRLTLMASHAESRSDHQTVRDALEAAATLTHLLLFYKAEIGSLGIDINARTPGDLIEELAMSTTHQSSISVTTNTSDSPTLWYYDENLVRLVLLDVVYNALRYAKTKIEISAREENGFLEFRIADDGPGFSNELLNGNGLDNGSNFDGTGLGLHLAKHIAALHKNAQHTGSIKLGNQDGAVFILRLPQ